MTRFNCEKCDFHGDHKGKFEDHKRSKKHKMNYNIDDTDEEYKHNCLPCNYHTHNGGHFRRHCLSDKHKINTKNNTDNKEISYDFNCENCNFHTNFEYKFDEHVESEKHNIVNIVEEIDIKIIVKMKQKKIKTI